jgi:hypothetical protein
MMTSREKSLLIYLNTKGYYEYKVESLMLVQRRMAYLYRSGDQVLYVAIATAGMGIKRYYQSCMI